MLTFGVDHVAENAHLFTGRVALVTAPTGRDSLGRSTASVLKAFCDLRLLLAPEHGIHGNRAAGEEFGGETDPETGLEVMSLYSPGSKRLPEEAFSRMDTVVYDIQDVGCRYYTFISTLKYMVQDCAAHGKRLIVLDRPNPLGAGAEGILLRREVESFVGCHPIPARYGLTCGEFARLVCREEQLQCDLHVICCQGLTRDMTFPDWGRDWLRPSPNIPDYETALLYPGTCLIEGTNLSEGRGTAAPFRLIGAPFVDGRQLCDALGQLPGVTVAPTQFTPAASKHAGTPCGGIRLTVTDPGALQSVALGLHLIKTLHTLYPDSLQFLPGENMPFLSQLTGTPILPAHWDMPSFFTATNEEAARFQKAAEGIRLY